MKLIPNNKNVCKECTTPNICRDKGAFNSCRLVTKKDIDKIHKSPILKRIKPTIPMSSELNEKLKHFLDAFDRYDEYSWDDKQEAADKLEQLILNRDIELLKKLQSDKFVYETIGITISELTQQLNKLKG